MRKLKLVCAIRRLSSANQLYRNIETIETKDVNKQLNLSLLDPDEEGWKLEVVEHDLDERRYTAQILCSEPSSLMKEASLDRHIRIIKAIVAFC